MMAKISVKGKDMHPIYKFLTNKELNGKISSSVNGIFKKYLIDEKGILVKVISPQTSPLDKEIIEWVENSK